MSDAPRSKRRVLVGPVPASNLISPLCVGASHVFESGSSGYWSFTVRPDGMVYKMLDFFSTHEPLGWHASSLHLNDELLMHSEGKSAVRWRFASDRAISLRYPDHLDISIFNYTADPVLGWFSISFWREIDRS